MRVLSSLNAALIFFAVITVCAACLIGSTALPASSIAKALMLQGSAGDQIVLWEIRLPRTMAAFSVSTALGASGAAMQGLFEILADPGVLGVSACASSPPQSPFVRINADERLDPADRRYRRGACGDNAARRCQSVHPLCRHVIAHRCRIVGFTAAVMALLLNLAPNPFSLSDMLNWSLIGKPRRL